MEVNRKLLCRTTAPETVQSTRDSTVSIDKDEIAVSVSTDRKKKMSRTFSSTILTTRLHSTAIQSDLGVHRDIKETSPSLSDPRDSEPIAYRTLRVCHCPNHRTLHHGKTTEYEALWYGFSIEDNTYKPASELPTKFIRCY